MITIIDSVGRGCKNHPADVKKIQELLNSSAAVTNKLVTDGKYGQRTFQTILQYQMSIFHSPAAWDGIIKPNGKTLQSLNNPRTPIMKKISAEAAQAQARAVGGHAAPDVSPAATQGAALTPLDFENAARALGANVEAAMIHAFAVVESGGKSGFGASGFPKIAYEGHIFRRYTEHAYDRSHPLLSYPYAKKAGPEWQANNKDDATALATLKQAILLNQRAAYMSCSWGMFQIMGFNFSSCGYATVDAFVDAMKAGESGQLKAFVGFCKNTAGLKDALAKKDFVQCATLYNGADYGDYDRRISAAYKKFSTK
ncbi:MAG: N-acetylmuramidase family protein [Pseudomonadota bacterium]|nr:N-acetylmuramidase family protein [Pseudomonadota bacterium]